LSLDYALLGIVHSLSGDLKSGQRDEEEALKLAQESKSKMGEGLSQIYLGSILGAADTSRSAEAEEHILQGIRLLEELKLRPMCSMGYFYLGEHYASTGRREEALQTLKKAEAAFHITPASHPHHIPLTEFAEMAINPYNVSGRKPEW